MAGTSIEEVVQAIQQARQTQTELKRLAGVVEMIVERLVKLEKRLDASDRAGLRA